MIFGHTLGEDESTAVVAPAAAAVPAPAAAVRRRPAGPGYGFPSSLIGRIPGGLPANVMAARTGGMAPSAGVVARQMLPNVPLSNGPVRRRMRANATAYDIMRGGAGGMPMPKSVEEARQGVVRAQQTLTALQTASK